MEISDFEPSVNGDSPLDSAVNSRCDRGPVCNVPNEYIGRLLDHDDKTGQYALFLLVYLIHHGKDYPIYGLNRWRLKGHMCGDAFQAALRLLKDLGILRRKVRGPRGYAVDELVPPASSSNFTSVNVAALDLPCDVFAFIVVVLLSEPPLRPAVAAKRIGIKSLPTVYKVSAAAAKAGYIATFVGPNRTTWVGRPGTNFSQHVGSSKNQSTKTKSSKNHGAHSKRKNLTVEGRETQNTKDSTVRNAPKDGAAGLLLELSDWKTSEYFNSFGFIASPGLTPGGSLSLAEWRMLLKRFCGETAPVHLMTRKAHRQAVEITTFLCVQLGWVTLSDDCKQIANSNPVQVREMAIAVAGEIAKAVAKGRTIRSLGFIAERLGRSVEHGDESFVFDRPVTLSERDEEIAHDIAIKGAAMLEANGKMFVREWMLGSRALEEIHDARCRFGSDDAVLDRMQRHAKEVKLREGYLLIGWTF